MNYDNTNEVFDGAFRIIGDNLDPEQITSLLGIDPDYSHKKGEANNRKNKLGKIIVGTPHKTGIWTINSDLPETSTLEEHIVSLLVRLDSAHDKIRQLSKEGYRVDIYCGHFLKHGYQGGFDVSPEVLERMGKMGIHLAVSTHEM